MAIKAYNKLPNRYKISNEKVFKQNIKKLLLSKCYYSISEYFSDKGL